MSRVARRRTKKKTAKRKACGPAKSFVMRVHRRHNGRFCAGR